VSKWSCPTLKIGEPPERSTFFPIFIFLLFFVATSGL